MASIRKINVQGGTILEVLIALTISSFAAALAGIIYLNIQKSSLPFFKLKAIELAELYMQQAFEKNSFTDEVLNAEEFVIKKTVTQHNVFMDCDVVRIIVFDGAKKKLCELESTVIQNR